MAGISVDDYNTRATKFGAPHEFRGVVMSLHGIMARGTWQSILSPELQIAGFLHIPVDLGYISLGVLGSLAPLTAGKAEYSIRDKYNMYHTIIERTGLSLLAHSFGTYCAARTFLRGDWMQIKRVIFVGSIVPKDYPWDIVIENCGISGVLNEVGIRDRWVRLAPYFISGSGDSGFAGFQNGAPIVKNKIHTFTDHHSLFDIGYARNTWIPFLCEKP